eukprot:1923586-Amphidinium_carterae.1
MSPTHCGSGCGQKQQQACIQYGEVHGNGRRGWWVASGDVGGSLDLETSAAKHSLQGELCGCGNPSSERVHIIHMVSECMIAARASTTILSTIGILLTYGCCVGWMSRRMALLKVCCTTSQAG